MLQSTHPSCFPFWLAAAATVGQCPYASIFTSLTPLILTRNSCYCWTAPICFHLRILPTFHSDYEQLLLLDGAHIRKLHIPYCLTVFNVSQYSKPFTLYYAKPDETDVKFQGLSSSLKILFSNTQWTLLPPVKPNIQVFVYHYLSFTFLKHWSNLRYYPSNCLEGPPKTMIKLQSI